MEVRHISKSQFKPKALEFFRDVQKTGKPIIITDHGRPVLKLIPYTENTESILSSLRNTVTRYENPLEPVGVADWEALK